MAKFLWSLIHMIIVWSIFYGFEIYRGMWTADVLWVQIIFGFFFFLNAMIYVPYGEYKELVFRLSQKKVRILYEGIIFKPFLGLFWKVIIPKEFQDNTKIRVNLDISTKDVLRHRQIVSRKEDFIITVLTWIFPVLKKVVWWNVFLCLILGFGIAKSSLYIKKNLIDKDKIKVQAIQEEQRVVESPRKNYNYNKSTNQQSNPRVNSYNNNQSDWYPDRPYQENMTWDRVLARDKYSVTVIVDKTHQYINVVGNFVWHYNSDNYYPHIYVDGYEGDDNFYCNFFDVHINYLSLANGQTWSNIDMSFCKYISIVSNKDKMSDDCYRDINIYPKPQFRGKIKWHLLDAGWGKSKPFKVSTANGQYMTSLRDSETFGISMYDITPKQNYNSQANQPSAPSSSSSSKNYNSPKTSDNTVEEKKTYTVQDVDGKTYTLEVKKNKPKRD